jgi:GT2 family glycosyltransferase
VRVVAILVARSGGDHLATTIAALAKQTRPVDVLIAVDNGSRGSARSQLEDARPAHILSTGGAVPLGEAVDMAARVVAASPTVDDCLWILGQDSAPQPTALEHLVGALEVSRSAVVVGPKQYDAQSFEPGSPGTILEFGQSLSPRGQTIPLVENELDQGQYDTMSDVLAVGANGMLVRESAWRTLGGFDTGLPVVDDALDFCVRVRLSGSLVQVVPAAVVMTHGDGVTALPRVERERDRRREFRQIRRAELYRRMVYARALAPLLIWLSLVPWAVVRLFGQMLAKRPGLVGGELSAALSVAFSLGSIGRSRARLRGQRRVSWASLSGVRLAATEVRRRRTLSREAARIRLHGEKRSLYFFAGGGAWTIVALSVISFAVLFPLVGATSIAGGALLPAGHSLAEMWSLVGYGWRPGSAGLIGPADPFTLILALLGSLTWWQPSFVLVVIWFVAIPLSGLGAWMLTARLTERFVIRAFAALSVGVAPTLLIALSDGRPGAVLTHIALPWLFLAGFRAARSWSASATTALLFAFVTACSPSLAPALLVVWVGSVLLTGRYVPRFLAIPIPAAILFGPLILTQLSLLNPLALLADPGPTVASPTTPAWQVVLGFPTPGLGGWLDVSSVAPLGLNIAAGIVVLAAVGVIAVLAIVGLFSPHPIRAQLALLVMLLGLVTAVGVSNIRFAFDGSVPTPAWSGSGLSLAWLALVIAATTGISVLRRFSVYPAMVGMLAVVVLAVPLTASFFIGRSVVVPGNDLVFPAYVSAQAAMNPDIRTIVLTAQPDGGVSASLERGLGPTLASSSTLVSTTSSASPALSVFGDIAGNLVSTSGSDGNNELRAMGVGFILLTSPQAETSGEITVEARDADARASAALFANPALQEVGVTSSGLLWRVPDVDSSVVAGLEPPALTEPLRSIIISTQALVLFLTVLLALPTGALAEARPRREIPGLEEDFEDFAPVDALGGDDDEPQN